MTDTTVALTASRTRHTDMLGDERWCCARPLTNALPRCDRTATVRVETRRNDEFRGPNVRQLPYRHFAGGLLP